MTKIGKRIADLKKSVDLKKTYDINEALDIILKSATAKFDESVDVAINLGVDPRHADQNIRSTVVLPNGTGKKVRVAVFATDDKKIQEAKDAGADIVGSDELIEQINKGNIDFDCCVATPDTMALVGRVAKVLGPKGLMPNPKLGTVTPKIGEAVTAAKTGKIEFRVDKNGIVHSGVGKASFGREKLLENIKTVYQEIQRKKPQSLKGSYLKGFTVASTMGLGLSVDLSSL